MRDFKSCNKLQEQKEERLLTMQLSCFLLPIPKRMRSPNGDITTCCTGRFAGTEGRRFVPAVVFWGKERDKQVRIALL